MSTIEEIREFTLPDRLKSQLTSYRRSVWLIKSAEALAVATCGLMASWLAVFALDRLWDTSAAVRGAAMAVVAVGLILLPIGLYRWVWRRRSLRQVAALICRKLPGPGDRLLGVIDLVSDPSEQERSPVLCQAAIEQVDREAEAWQLGEGLPDSRHRHWWVGVAAMSVLLMLLALIALPAVSNSLARLIFPWKDIPRYTFAALENVTDEKVIPHGETSSFVVSLAEGSRWKPDSATLSLQGHAPLRATLHGNSYSFELPAQIDPSEVRLKVGDAYRDIALTPTLRPELSQVSAQVELPSYLQRTEPLTHDVRGGVLTLVNGSTAHVQAEANRRLASASINEKSRPIDGAKFESENHPINEPAEMMLRWTDHVGLEGKEPFKIEIAAGPDEAPAISSTGLMRQQVVLVSEQLSFQLASQDDFGVKEVGMQWQGYRFDGKPSATKGSAVVSAGGPDREVLNASGTFNAETLGIEPQAIELRFYAKDYLQDREPSLSPPIVLYVLSPDEHAIWLTEQLNKWHRHALEVRDRELKLHEANKQIRAMPAESLDDPETRRMIERQVSAENANGRRLGTLAQSGEEIIQKATRNPEFGVGHLEKWAEMLQILKDISANRMPSVAHLLKDAAEAPKVASKQEESKPSHVAGVDRGPPGAQSDSEDAEKKDDPSAPPIPQIVDRESSEQPPEEGEQVAGGEKKSGSAPLSLPVTTLVGKAKQGDACPAGDSMQEAVDEQRDLLAEFEKVANELNNILANLEGSTLIKRLKAESRQHTAISESIGDLLESSFGIETDESDFDPITQQENLSATRISYIMDDMQAYFDRRPFAQFKTVLTEMRDSDVLGSLRKLEEDIPEENGVSIAQCEYWADTLDRWAEDLVDPASGGT